MEENKYKAALERAKSAIKECGNNLGRIKMIESIFSDELWESEDEQTRKQLLDLVHRYTLAPYSDRDRWVAYLEKVKNFDEQLEQAYKNSDEVQYKRGYDDGYLEGMASAKQELEKQGEHANFLSKIQVGDKVTRNEDGVLVNLSQLNRVVKKLEKQDEQSKEVTYTHEVETGNGNIKALVTEKVQLPKFKVGDFIVNDYCMGRVVEITNDAYLLDTGQGIPFSCEHNAHLWSISDAKDGDVLQLGKVTAIFKKYIGNGNCKCYCSVYDGEFEIPNTDNSYGCHNAIPATKEQRGILFQKMHKAGYEWDDEKKETKLLISNGGDFEPELTHKEVTKKSDKVWNEEDEKNLQGVIDEIQANKSNAPEYDLKTYDKFLSWLKSIKDRVQPQPKQEWGKEDEMSWKNAIEAAVSYFGLPSETVNWLKSIKQRLL